LGTSENYHDNSYKITAVSEKNKDLRQSQEKNIKKADLCGRIEAMVSGGGVNKEERANDAPMSKGGGVPLRVGLASGGRGKNVNAPTTYGVGGGG